VVELPHARLNFAAAPRNHLDRDGMRAEEYRTETWGLLQPVDRVHAVDHEVLAGRFNGMMPAVPCAPGI
jgi:hypothetical protein